jgi:hypothetical protein
LVCLIRQSESTLLQGELARLMWGAVVLCFLVPSCSKIPIPCRYMASISGFVRWGTLRFFLATSLHACLSLCHGHIMLPHLLAPCLANIGCMLHLDSMLPKLYVVSRTSNFCYWRPYACTAFYSTLETFLFWQMPKTLTLSQIHSLPL